MIAHQKTIGLPKPGNSFSFNLPDYSNIIDINVYTGGYNEVYCHIFYTTPNDVSPENKKVNILCLDSSCFKKPINKIPDPWDRTPPTTEIDDRYQFLKSVIVDFGRDKVKYFIFTFEELSTSEERDSKISDLIS